MADFAALTRRLDDLQRTLTAVVLVALGVVTVAIVTLIFALSVWRHGELLTLSGDANGPSNANVLLNRNPSLNFTCANATDFVVCTTVNAAGLCFNPQCRAFPDLSAINITCSSTVTGTVGTPELITINPAVNFTCNASALLICSSVTDAGLCFGPICVAYSAALCINITNSSTITGTTCAPEANPTTTTSASTTVVTSPANIRFVFRTGHCVCVPPACATNGICGPGNVSELSDTEANVGTFRISRVGHDYTISMAFATQQFKANDVCGCVDGNNRIDFLEASWDVPPFNDTDIGLGLGATGYPGTPGAACFFIADFYSVDLQKYIVCFNGRVITIRPTHIRFNSLQEPGFFGFILAQLSRGLSYTYTVVS